MRWLITGGSGFIGSNLIERLIGDGGHAIRIVDDLSTGSEENLSPCASIDRLASHDALDGCPAPSSGGGVQLITGDIRDAALASAAAEGMDVIVHLAASAGVITSIDDPVKDFNANALGTLNYLEAARNNGVQAFILASSGAVVGEADPPLHERLPCSPISPYGASKLTGEAYCSAYHGAYGVRTVALRFANVYGPRSTHKESVIAKFIKRALDGDVLVVYGDGEQTRDFVFVEDLVDAIVRSARQGKGGAVYQVATAQETTVNTLIDVLSAQCTKTRGVTPAVTHEPERAGEVRRNFADIARAKRDLGWEPAIGLEEGIRRTVEWFSGRRG